MDRRGYSHWPDSSVEPGDDQSDLDVNITDVVIPTNGNVLPPLELFLRTWLWVRPY